MPRPTVESTKHCVKRQSIRLSVRQSYALLSQKSAFGGYGYYKALIGNRTPEVEPRTEMGDRSRWLKR